MNLYFRLLAALSCYVVPRKAQSLEAEVRTPFRVLPQDLDTNFHMNNGRYLTLMDLGRLDYMAKVGLLWPSVKLRVLPVLGASQMVYLRSLKLWQRFELVTQLECWDDKWFVMQQRFEHEGRVCALGRVRGVFRRGGKNLPPEQLLRAYGPGPFVSPTPSPATAAWLDSLKAR